MKQDRQQTCKEMLWSIRIIFIPPRVSQKPATTSKEENAFMAVKCRRQKQKALRSSCKVPYIFTRF